MALVGEQYPVLKIGMKTNIIMIEGRLETETSCMSWSDEDGEDDEVVKEALRKRHHESCQDLG